MSQLIFYETRIATLEQQREDLYKVLAEIVGQEKPNDYGYDAACVALDNSWRVRARAVLAGITLRG